MNTYQEGQPVKHEQDGEGTIVASDEERTSIDFVEHGTKKFVTSLVVLEPSQESPRPRAAKARRSSRRRGK